jgi:superfamily II DNA/RNA helicase
MGTLHHCCTTVADRTLRTRVDRTLFNVRTYVIDEADGILDAEFNHT